MSLGKVLGQIGSGLLGGAPSAILNLGTSLIGGTIGNAMARSNMNAQNAWSEKMNAQQQAWQEEMWNKNNEYNSPQQMMQRLIEAGVNPNNAAGLVSGTGGQAQMAQQPVIPGSNPVTGPNMTGNSGFNLNWEQERKQIEEAAAKLSAERTFINTQESTWVSEKTADIAAKYASVRLSNSSADLNDSQKKVADYQYEHILPELARLNKAEADNAITAGLELVERIALMKEQEKTEKAQQSAAYAAANKANEEAGLAAQQIENAKLQGTVIEETGRGIRQENDMRQIKVDISLANGIPLEWMNNWENVVMALRKQGMNDKQIQDWFRGLQDAYTKKIAGGRESRSEGPIRTMNSMVSTAGTLINPLVPLSRQLK